LSSAQRFETITQLQEKYPGLILAGNIRNGIGMADRIKQARDIAEELK
jgi:oxygen-dependent protoporphyrinogen oxidase